MRTFGDKNIFRMRSYSTLIVLTVPNYGACGVADLQNNFIRAKLRCVLIFSLIKVIIIKVLLLYI
jgi:hypothetical protein